MILGVSGRSMAGKSSISNWLTGLWMQKYGLIEYHYVDHDGDLVVPIELDGKIEDKVIRINRESIWLRENVYPYVKQYSFADKLKQFCMDVYGLTYEQCYTQQGKIEKTKIQWSGFPKEIRKKFNAKPKDFLTVRELLQAFGTEIVRKIYSDAWVESCVKQIASDQPEFAIITDVRFPNEVKGVHDAGGLTLRLLRNPINSDHESESALDPYKFDQTQFSAILDNSQLTFAEQNEQVFEILHQWGWINFTMDKWESPKALREKARHISEGAMRIK